jgi:replicative DNA helicase
MINVPLPANPEAETAILGSLLIDPDAVQRVRSFLKTEHFYIERNAWIYQAIVDLDATGKPADFLTVSDALEERKQLDEIGGAAYVMDLINSVPTAIHAEYYAEIVVKLARDRQAIRLAQQITEQAYQCQGRALDMASTLLQDARNGFAATIDGPRFLDDVLDEVVQTAETMDKARKAGGLVDIKLPWQDLTDIVVGGLLPADLLLVVGEPSVGKSTFVHQIADHAAQYGHGVLMLTTETRDVNFAARQLAPRAGVASRDLLSGNLDERGWLGVMQNMDKVRRASMMVDCTTYDAQAFERRIQQASAALEQRGLALRLVVFDFLQQFRDSRYKEKRLEVGAVIYQIRELMVRYGLTGIVVSELDKGSYKNGGKVHIFGAKESGSIEYAATVGVALYRNEQERVVCDVQKNKDGKRGSFILPALADNAAWFGSARPYTVIQPAAQARLQETTRT